MLHSYGRHGYAPGRVWNKRQQAERRPLNERFIGAKTMSQNSREHPRPAQSAAGSSWHLNTSRKAGTHGGYIDGGRWMRSSLVSVSAHGRPRFHVTDTNQQSMRLSSSRGYLGVLVSQATPSDRLTAPKGSSALWRSCLYSGVTLPQRTR